MGESEIFIQRRLGGENEQGYRAIVKGTVICPELSGRGSLREDIVGEKLRRRIKGYPGWKARTPIPLYFDNERWELPSGTNFGAPRGSDRKIGGRSSKGAGSKK